MLKLYFSRNIFLSLIARFVNSIDCRKYTLISDALRQDFKHIILIDFLTCSKYLQRIKLLIIVNFILKSIMPSASPRSGLHQPTITMYIAYLLTCMLYLYYISSNYCLMCLFYAYCRLTCTLCIVPCILALYVA